MGSEGGERQVEAVEFQAYHTSFQQRNSSFIPGI